jgi:hypothetical protein
MKKNNIILYTLALLVAGTLTVVSCKKDTPPPTEDVPAAPTNYSFVEEFDTVAEMSNRGWVLLNSSEPIGANGWAQGKYTFGGKAGGAIAGFVAYSAHNLPTDYASADVTAVNDLGGISTWMISPVLQVKNGDRLIFNTRSGGNAPDRMQVRANFNDLSTDVGAGVNGVGKFTLMLLDINPSLAAGGTGGYPTSWTRYAINISGLTGVKTGRIAFRYYIPSDGGNSGNNSDQVGIDSCAFVSN